MTRGIQQPIGGAASIDAESRRASLERRAGIALTVLLHIGLLALLLTSARPPQIKPQLVQAMAVVEMQLLPQAQLTPVAVSRPKPPTRPRPKPKPIPPKPLVVTPAQVVPVVPPSVAEPAPLASATAPSRPASMGIVEPLPMAYLTHVMMTIGLNRRYPLKALANREQGTAVVHIHLSRDGSVLDVTVIKSSGYPVLDAEARDVVLRIAKFQALAPEYARGAEDFAIDQPIRFTGY